MKLKRQRWAFWAAVGDGDVLDSDGRPLLSLGAVLDGMTVSLASQATPTSYWGIFKTDDERFVPTPITIGTAGGVLGVQ